MKELYAAEQAVQQALHAVPEHARSSVEAALEHLRRARAVAQGAGERLLGGLSPAELGALVRQQRERAGLSQADLGKRAGLSKRTIQYVEQGAHPCEADTVKRLSAVPELQVADALVGTRASEEASTGPDSWILPLYNRASLLRELQDRLNSAGGALEQTMLYLDDQSASDWMAVCSGPAFAARFRSLPLDQAADAICQSVGVSLDLNALGAGDGRSEVRLAEEILSRRAPRMDLRLHLLDISHPLLVAANEHARAVLGRRASVQTLHGNFHHLARFPVLLPSAHRTRCYLMLGGTLQNLDNDVVWLREQLGLAAPGDFALIDVGLSFASPAEPDRVRALDPMLQRELPEAHARWFSGPVHRYCRDLKSVALQVELNLFCPMPGSYELDMYAAVERQDRSRQRYLLARARRYGLPELRSCLESFGWRWLWHQPYGHGQTTALVLLQRT